MNLEPHRIPPGLDSLPYRVGTWASFLAAMRQAMSSGRWPALQGLRTRESDDAAIALCDAWAVVADVLSFYQERIANEGYLGTARERASIEELGRMTGYALRPGVAAEVFLAYALAPGAQALVAPGHRVQTVPPPGNQPQTFESVDPLQADAHWNRLALRMSRPQLVTPASDTVYLAGTSSQLKKNAALVLDAGGSAVLRRVAALTPDPVLNRTQLVLQPVAAPPAATAKGRAARHPAHLAVAGRVPDVVGTPLLRMIELVDPLTQAPAAHPSSAAALRRTPATTYRVFADTTPALLTRLLPGLAGTLYPALGQTDVAAPPTATVHALRIQAAPFGHAAPRRQVTDAKGVVIASEEWAIGDSVQIRIELDASAPEQGTAGAELRIGSLSIGRKTRKSELGITIDAGGVHASVALALPDTDRTVPVGPWSVDIVPALNAAVPSLEFRFSPAPVTRKLVLRVLDRGEAISLLLDATADSIDVAHGESTQRSGDGEDITLAFGERVLIVDERALAPDPRVIALDSLYDEILPGSWVSLERPELATDADPAYAALARVVTRVSASRRTTVSRYNQNARVTELTLDDPWLDPGRDRSLGTVRSTVVCAQSEPLPLAEEPITEAVAGDTLELDGLYPGLESGRWLIVQGERSDLPGAAGVQAAERVMLQSLLQDVRPQKGPGLLGDSAARAAVPDAGARPGETTHSFLRLTSPLGYQYRRDTVRIHGNVTRATHGETRFEILGHGDASQAGQAFLLHIPPLTQVPAATADGRQSTLAILVNEQPWQEVASLATAGPRDRVYTTRTDADGTTRVRFGDGVHGARLPSGLANVRAQYRSGMGADGNVDAGLVSLQMTRPAGVKEIVNPMPAFGGADAESRDEARANVPGGLADPGRLVTLADYAARARSFAGVSKAAAVRLGSGSRALVALTVAANGGAELPAQASLLLNLAGALQQAAGPRQRLVLRQRELRVLVAALRISSAAGVLWDDLVLRVRSALLERFGFAQRALGQAVTRAEFEAAARAVRGVANVAVLMLDSIAVADATTPASLSAKLASIARAAAPAEQVPALPGRAGPGNAGFLPAQLLLLDATLPDTLILVQG